MTTQAELHNLTGKLGEVGGQMRELIHQQNNMAQKLDGLTERMLTSPTAAEYTALSERVAKLEAVNHRRDGATGLGMAILKSPAVGWLVGIVAAAFATIKGGLFK